MQLRKFLMIQSRCPLLIYSSLSGYTEDGTSAIAFVKRVRKKSLGNSQ